MFLVAGLAVAGLAGIAAAFYFSMRPSRAADRSGASTVIDFTGPQQVLDDDPAPRRRLPEPDTEKTEKAVARSHRRVGWRKASDVDEELWPAEEFGGVSDEQFWDDLAADKPLATTARTAQPETATRRRPPNAGPLPDLYPAAGPSAPEGPGTHPQPRLDPDDRTAIQPAPALSRPSPAAGPPAAPRERSRSVISPDEDPLTSPAYALRTQGSVDGRSGQPSTRGWYPDTPPASRQFDRPAHGANGRGRPDPLWPDAYRPDPWRSDRSRSEHLRPDPLRADRYRPDPLRADRYWPDPLRPDQGQAAATHPYPQQPYGEPTLPVSAPPYGERYGYGNPAGQPSPAADPRRENGAGLTGTGEGRWGSRPAQPPVNGYRGPYDPRGQDRRLTPLH
jgi:hypothetical protein